MTTRTMTPIFSITLSLALGACQSPSSSAQEAPQTQVTVPSAERSSSSAETVAPVDDGTLGVGQNRVLEGELAWDGPRDPLHNLPVRRYPILLGETPQLAVSLLTCDLNTRLVLVDAEGRELVGRTAARSPGALTMRWDELPAGTYALQVSADTPGHNQPASAIPFKLLVSAFDSEDDVSASLARETWWSQEQSTFLDDVWRRATDGDVCAMMLSDELIPRGRWSHAEAYAAHLSERCAAGSSPHCVAQLASQTLDAAGEARLLELATSACAAHDLYSCYVAMGTADALDQPDAQRLELLRGTCDAGGTAECYLLGQALEERVFPMDGGINTDALAEAQHAYERACEAGHGAACAGLGELLVGAYQVQFEAACFGGDDAACTQMERPIVAEEGSPANLAFVSGCRLMDLDACENLLDAYAEAGREDLADQVRASLCTPALADDAAHLCP